MSDRAATVDEEVGTESEDIMSAGQKVLDIQVVTASENGAVHLWKPMEVRILQMLSLIGFLPFRIRRILNGYVT